MRLAEILRAERKKKELSIRGMAGLCKCSPTTVTKAEKGGGITVETAIRLLNALGLAIAVVPVPTPGRKEIWRYMIVPGADTALQDKAIEL